MLVVVKQVKRRLPLKVSRDIGNSVFVLCTIKKREDLAISFPQRIYIQAVKIQVYIFLSTQSINRIHYSNSPLNNATQQQTPMKRKTSSKSIIATDTREIITTRH